ncbi:Ig-like domain-containing protein [Actinoplanes sp. CA-142083]|uniref:Ig-like domain-containing protein n=1 Tax=Actinoplanes sp. CA-142083 TaxID=3239903 RepID=UPI003D8DBBC5
MRPKKIFTTLAAALGAALMAVVATAGPAMADTQGTSTDLFLPSGRVVQGQEPNFVMSVGISSATEGGWIIEAGSPTFPTKILCGGALPGQTTCTMSPDALPPGNYNLLAFYGGTENFSPSASGLVPLTVVAQQPTSTSLTLSPATVVLGHEDNGTLQVQVNGDTGNAAQGTASVLLNSAPLSQCDNLPLFGGVNSCRLGASELQPGTYQLTARFNGSRDFAVSTSAPQTLTVVPQQPTTMNVGLSAPSVPFGGEQAETIDVTVVPSIGGTPTGFVSVKTGSTTVCGFFLANAKGKCSLTASQLPPGSYPLTVTYGGDDTYATSTNTSQTLVVAKQPTLTQLTMSADTIAVGSEQAELFTVDVTSSISGTPTGNVTVKAGATAVCTIILASGTGNCNLTARQLARGTYQMTATYNGNGTYATSVSSPPQTLTVLPRRG